MRVGLLIKAGAQGQHSFIRLIQSLQQLKHQQRQRQDKHYPEKWNYYLRFAHLLDIIYIIILLILQYILTFSKYHAHTIYCLWT